jgi:ATP-binding cassette subfamily F protein uup
LFNGNYSSYRYELEIEKQQAKTNQAAVKIEPKAQPKKSKLAFKEQQELKALDTEIPGVEDKIKSLTERLNSGLADHAQLSDLARQIKVLTDELDEKSLRWMELTELSGL